MSSSIHRTKVSRARPATVLGAFLALTATACIDPDTGTAAHALEAPDAGEPAPPACASNTGALVITNHMREPIRVDVAESTGVISTITVPPGRSDRWQVATGYTGVEAHAASVRAPVFGNTYEITCDGIATVDIQAPDFALPRSAIMTVSGRQLTAGELTCDPGRATTSLSTRVVGANLEYRLTCNDPAAPRTTRTLALQVPRASVVGGLPPEPVRTCVEHFRAFRTTPELPYFHARFDAHALDCGAWSTPGGPIDFGFPSTAPPSPVPGSSGDLAIIVHHSSTPDGNLSYDTYDQATSLFSGETGNTVNFRYRNKAADASPPLGYMLQIAGTKQDSTPFADPCADWAAPADLVEQTLISPPQAGSAPFTTTFSRFYQHLAGPAVFYARVVPLTTDVFGDPVCTLGPSNWVELDVADNDPVADPNSAMNQHVWSPPTPPSAKYTATIVSYLPPVLSFLRWDADRVYYTTKPNPNSETWPDGCEYVVEENQGNTPWYKSAWNGIVGAIDALNTLYGDIKAAVFNETVAKLPGCGDDCKGAIASGLADAGANLRIPTRLPNLDDALNAAVPYTAWFIARRVEAKTGVPAATWLDEFTSMGHGIAGLVRWNLGGATAADPGDMYTWGNPEPYWLPRPAVVWVQITRDDFAGADQGSSFLVADSNHIWKPADVAIPALPPNGSLIVPVFLEPAYKDIVSNEGLQSYNDAANHAYWQSQEYAYGAGVMHLDVHASGQAPAVLVQPAGLQYGTYGMLEKKTACP